MKDALLQASRPCVLSCTLPYARDDRAWHMRMHPLKKSGIDQIPEDPPRSNCSSLHPCSCLDACTCYRGCTISLTDVSQCPMCAEGTGSSITEYITQDPTCGASTIKMDQRLLKHTHQNTLRPVIPSVCQYILLYRRYAKVVAATFDHMYCGTCTHMTEPHCRGPSPAAILFLSWMSRWVVAGSTKCRQWYGSLVRAASGIPKGAYRKTNGSGAATFLTGTALRPFRETRYDYTSPSILTPSMVLLSL